MKLMVPPSWFDRGRSHELGNHMVKRMRTLDRCGERQRQEFWTAIASYLRVHAAKSVSVKLQRKCDANDIAQQSLIDVLSDHPNFRGQTDYQLKAWLRTIVLRNVHDASRRYFDVQCRDGGRERSMLASDRIYAPDPTPSREVSGKETAAMISAAIGQLPDEKRAVVQLRLVDGLSHQEISEQLDQSETAIRKSYSRCLVDLRRLLWVEV